MKITEDQLRRACKGQLKLFQEMFPEGASFNSKEEAIELAQSVAHKFDFDWPANNLLRGKLLAAYLEAEAPLLAAYLEARDPLLAVYLEARDPLWAAFEEAEATLLAAYEEAEAPLLAAYEEAEAPLLAAYREATAKLFAELYWEQENEDH